MCLPQQTLPSCSVFTPPKWPACFIQCVRVILTSITGVARLGERKRREYCNKWTFGQHPCVLPTEFIGKVPDIAILHIYKTTECVATVLCVCLNKSYLDAAWLLRLSAHRALYNVWELYLHRSPAWFVLARGRDAKTAINRNLDSILVCCWLNSSEKSLIWLYYIYIKRPKVSLQVYVAAATKLTFMQCVYST